jgi:hypothetical protein
VHPGLKAAGEKMREPGQSDAAREAFARRFERAGMDPPLVDLDPRYFKLLDEFEKRFPSGPPSLLRAERLMVRGDVTFP